MDMTPRAAERVAAGATAGAGTATCLKCGGPKEPGRLNSDRCLPCNGGKRMIRFPVDTGLWSRLEQEADSKGVAVDDMVRGLLLARDERLNRDKG